MLFSWHISSSTTLLNNIYITLKKKITFILPTQKSLDEQWVHFFKKTFCVGDLSHACKILMGRPVKS